MQEAAKPRAKGGCTRSVEAWNRAASTRHPGGDRLQGHRSRRDATPRARLDGRREQSRTKKHGRDAAGSAPSASRSLPRHRRKARFVFDPSATVRHRRRRTRRRPARRQVRPTADRTARRRSAVGAGGHAQRHAVDRDRSGNPANVGQNDHAVLERDQGNVLKRRMGLRRRHRPSGRRLPVPDGARSNTPTRRPATHEVTVTITTDDLASPTITLQATVFVKTATPTAQFSDLGEADAVRRSRSTPEARSTRRQSAVKYAWKFGDGAETTTTSPSIQHEYTAAGTYSVTLTVSDATSCAGRLDEHRRRRAVAAVAESTGSRAAETAGAADRGQHRRRGGTTGGGGVLGKTEQRQSRSQAGEQRAERQPLGQLSP